MGKSVFPLAEGQATENIERMAVRRVINLQVGMMIAVVLWLFFAVGASLLAGPRSDATRVATLAQVQGAVDILIADDSNWQPVEVDTQIEAGTRVRTGPDAIAQLAFFDGSMTYLTSDTEVSIVQMSSRKKGEGKVIILQQWMGQTYHRVQPLLDADSRFEVETPSAVASVRGTEFVLDVESDGATQVVVVEGLVTVEAQEITVVVGAGHGTVARPKQPPDPAKPASTLPARVESLDSSGQTNTDPPGLTKTPQPPGRTDTDPPGQTKTPQPPGRTDTDPPGQTKTPQPPGWTDTDPPGQTKTPQPPGRTDTDPPGQTKTPQPPGKDKAPKPKPPKPPKKPKK